MMCIGQHPHCGSISFTRILIVVSDGVFLVGRSSMTNDPGPGQVEQLDEEKDFNPCGLEEVGHWTSGFLVCFL